MFAMPCYECWCCDRREWQEISETEIMNKLYKIYKRVTPVIKEMINGKEVQTPDGLYRLRFKGGGIDTHLLSCAEEIMSKIPSDHRR